MTGYEINEAIENAVILVDTREQETDRLKKRLESAGLPYIREKLNFGDYSIRTILPNGEQLDLSRVAVIERKMNLDELALCFGNQRKRFIREFERAKEASSKIYLLIENGTIDKMISGDYRSLMNSNAFVSSLIAFTARYNCIPIFCNEKNTGKIIKEILQKELKERLDELR